MPGRQGERAHIPTAGLYMPARERHVNTQQHWITRAEAALDGRPDPDVDIVGVRRPPVLDADGVKAVMAPFFAALFYMAAHFLELDKGSMYPGALLLNLIALGFTARAVILGVVLARRLGVYSKTARYGLALADGGLLYRSPDGGDLPIPRQDILEIRERGMWRKRTAARRYSPVYIITQPDTGRTHVELPPVLDESPSRLAERLQRWLGELDAPDDYQLPGASELPSKLFDAAAAGEHAPGTTVLRHGASWLRRGPYATILMGVALASGFLRLPQATQDRVGLTAPAIILFALLCVPILWFIMTRFDLASRKGLSLVLTPAETMLRTRVGVLVVRWKDLRQVEIDSGSGWSLLLGQHERRALVLHRNCLTCKGGGTIDGGQCKTCKGSGRDMDYISYVETFLGAPAEVVHALCSGYQTGRIRFEQTTTT